MTLQMLIRDEREDAAIEATIKSEFRCGVAEEEIITHLISDFDLTEKDAIDCMNDYKESLLQTT